MEFVIWAATAAGMWKMFEKAGEAGWQGLIPLYNTYKLCQIVMDNGWYFLRLLLFIIPVIGWIPGFYFLYQICKATARAYGQPDGYAWGYFFLSPVFYCITGFGDAEYYGPYGAGDTRTAQARQAKTVDFDVRRNEPDVQPYQEYTRPSANTASVNVEPAHSAEETVEFEFDQTSAD